ncbi:phosphatidylserine decarboxylase [Bacillaceae bacterium W0354]
MFKVFVELTGSRLISKLLVKFSNSKWSRGFVPLFAKVYKINRDEMSLSIRDYESLHHFFTRNLKKDARLVDVGKNVIVSPVDGVASQFGSIKDVDKVEVKKRELDFVEMLGSKEKADKYMGGKFIIFYLSPQHYHRIHSPFKGEIRDHWTLGGKSFPVNKLGLKFGDRPLSTNYRRITELETEAGFIAVVKVGALNVNSIHLTNQRNDVERGEELAYFSFGSTVILLIENSDFQFCDDLHEGKEMKFGEKVLFIP